MTILPASFTGGPHYMYSHYLEALAISRIFRNLAFFVTFTCNAKWPEIARYLKPFPHLSPSDRADIVARVFHMKVNEFINFLKDECPLGHVRGGTDRVAVRIAKPIGSDSRQSQQQMQPVDEIKNFIDARFICPHEACWRIFNFPIHHREPAVQIQAVHLENMQLVKFSGKQPLRAIVENNEAKKTTLTEWLNYNASLVNRRANLKKPSIGRISYIHPAYGEVFFLRMLLCHRKGCTSFADIRTVNQILHNTYRSACEAAGLLGDDREWSAVLEEASVSATSSQLRSLFTHILSYCTVTNPLALWENHWKLMGDDIPLRAAANLNMSHLHINADDLHNFVLYEVEILLNQCSKSISDFALPSLPADLLADLANRLIMEERNYDRAVLNAERLELECQMNSKQKKIYDLITSASLNEQTEHVFVYGHSGTGKTFLWKAIITALRSRGNIVLAVASSGIVSLLLLSGRTAHSRFKLPLAPMNDKHCFEALDWSLRDILGNTEEYFGGKSVILGGDFKQTLPIQTKGGKSAILSACITTSHFWK
ncbi:uncharacterized protein [Rutidosis leptorrhynchoides]|uniref:uncharacterized protein n=1 Tax=Rutidosis leptorrhynchoides TaxID=125765 RepID=UPI003A99245F